VSHNQSNKESFLIGAILCLLIGVPTVVFSIFYFSEKTFELAKVFIAALFIFVLLTSVLVIFRNKILKGLFNSTLKEVDKTKRDCSQIFSLINDGEISKAQEIGVNTINSIATYITWIQFKKWLLNISIGLIVAFSTLIGSSLLHKQNQYIKEQNKFFKEQIIQQQIQIKSQQAVDNQNIRRKAIEQIYDKTGLYSPRVKAEATKSFITTEKQIFSNTPNLLESKKRYVDLSGAILRDAWFQNSQLSFVNFNGADLYKSDFSNSTLRDMQFLNSNIEKGKFIAATLDSVTFNFCTADSIDLSHVIFKGEVVFKNCYLEHSTFLTSFTRSPLNKRPGKVTFENCDLRNANLNTLCDAADVKFMNCNIYKMKNNEMSPEKLVIGKSNYESPNFLRERIENKRRAFGLK